MTHPEIVQVEDLQFEIYIKEEEIQEQIEQIAKNLDESLIDSNPLFLGVLNGSFVFMAELVRACKMDLELRVIRLKSYEGTTSTGTIISEDKLSLDFKDRNVVIVEDIIDSGLTMSWLLEKIFSGGAKSVKVVSLLLKPNSLKHKIQIDYVGFEIPDNFVVGYGLDYNGKGRNLRNIYTLKG